MKVRLHISIVVPVYNEEENVHILYRKITDVCTRYGKPYEVIFVDDGSSDGTPEALLEIRGQDPRVRVIRFRKNYGQTPAMAAGFEHARGDKIVSMDADLQNDPEDIPALLNKLDEGYDLVCGWRKNRQDKLWTRKVPSVVANWIIGRLTGVRIHDNGCSLKAYRARVIKSVALYSEMHRFIPAMSMLAGARIAEVVVAHHARRYGQSKYGLDRVGKVALDIVKIKMITGFATRPALWFGLLSMPVALVAAFFLAIAGSLYLTDSTEGWLVVSTVSFLMFFLWAHFLSLGIVGELAVNALSRHRRESSLAAARLLKVPDVTDGTEVHHD